MTLFWKPPPAPFPTDLERPFCGGRHDARLPTWVYQALEFERLRQMQARHAPQRHDFGASHPFSILGWKLGDTILPAPPTYGHPEYLLEVFWVCTHLDPEKARASHSPVGVNLVQRISSANDPTSRPHHGVSLGSLLPTEPPPPLTRWTEAGHVFLSLRPRTFPEQLSGGGFILLAGEEAAVCLQAGHETPQDLLNAFCDRVRRAREGRMRE